MGETFSSSIRIITQFGLTSPKLKNKMVRSISHPNPQELAAFLRHLVNQKNGARFVSFKGYENKEGEISNIVVNIGVSYANAKERDIVKLSNAENFAHVKFEGTLVASFAEQARIALLESAIKPDVAKSEAQKDAYDVITPNLKIHKETGNIFVFGFVHSKEVVVKGNYKTVNSSALTMAKNVLRKELDAPKYRQYNIKKIGMVRINGEIIELL